VPDASWLFLDLSPPLYSLWSGIPNALFSEISVTDHGIVRWRDSAFFDAFCPIAPRSFSYLDHAIRSWRRTITTRLREWSNSLFLKEACFQDTHKPCGGAGNRLTCYLCISCAQTVTLIRAALLADALMLQTKNNNNVALGNIQSASCNEFLQKHWTFSESDIRVQRRERGWCFYRNTALTRLEYFTARQSVDYCGRYIHASWWIVQLMMLEPQSWDWWGCRWITWLIRGCIKITSSGLHNHDIIMYLLFNHLEDKTLLACLLLCSSSRQCSVTTLEIVLAGRRL